MLLDFQMISRSARFLSDATLAIARLLQDLFSFLFFFLICDSVSKLGKMSTGETEIYVE